MIFRDRKHAGSLLAKELIKYKGKDAVIYALPRGGVPVGNEIRKELGIPLTLIITRKIGHPMNPEYAICAVAEDGHTICNEFERSQASKEWLNEAIDKERLEIRRRKEKYLGGNPLPPKNKIAIIVDDGVATGLTMRLAIKEIREGSPTKIIVSVPVCPSDVREELEKEADEVIVLDKGEDYYGAVGAYYHDFPQVTDEEVRDLLKSKI